MAVQVGQVWLERRPPGRRLKVAEITADFAYCEVVGSIKRTRIWLARFQKDFTLEPTRKEA